MRHLFFLSHAPALVLCFSCASTEAASGPEGPYSSVPEICAELYEAAELRTDVRGIRTCLQDIQQRVPRQDEALQPGRGIRRQSDPIAAELEYEFELELSGLFNLIDVGLGASAEIPASTFESLAERFGVTHVVVGDYVRKAGDLLVTLRLVEAATNLIVASARGILPLDLLSDAALDLLHGDDEPPPVLVAEVVDAEEPPAAAQEPQAPPAPPIAVLTFDEWRTGRETAPAVTAASPTPTFEQWIAAKEAARVPRTSDVPTFEEWRAERRLKEVAQGYEPPVERAERALPGPAGYRLRALRDRQP